VLDIPPHQVGFLVLPAREWKPGETVKIEVIFNGRTIDRYSIPLAAPRDSSPVPLVDRNPSSLIVEEDGKDFLVAGEGFSVRFSAVDGMIHKISSGGEGLIESGPVLRLMGKLWKGHGWGPVEDLAGDWRLRQIDKKSYDDSVLVIVDGLSGKLPVHWRIKVDRQGVMDVGYRVSGFKRVRLREAGIKWKLAGGYDSLEWKRRAYWTWYPEGHPGASSGKAALISAASPPGYRDKPSTGWPMDSRDYFLFGKNGAAQRGGLTNLVKALRENIYFYRLTGGENSKMLTVLSNGMAGCRIRRANGQDMELIIDASWDYPDLNWGNYMREVVIENEFSGHFRLYLGREPLAD
jgi:hypothetical protein